MLELVLGAEKTDGLTPDMPAWKLLPVGLKFMADPSTPAGVLGAVASNRAAWFALELSKAGGSVAPLEEDVGRSNGSDTLGDGLLSAVGELYDISPWVSL
jgi:hypothetical protein